MEEGGSGDLIELLHHRQTAHVLGLGELQYVDEVAVVALQSSRVGVGEACRHRRTDRLISMTKEKGQEKKLKASFRIYFSLTCGTYCQEGGNA